MGTGAGFLADRLLASGHPVRRVRKRARGWRLVCDGCDCGCRRLFPGKPHACGRMGGRGVGCNGCGRGCGMPGWLPRGQGQWRVDSEGSRWTSKKGEGRVWRSVRRVSCGKGLLGLGPGAGAMFRKRRAGLGQAAGGCGTLADTRSTLLPHLPFSSGLSLSAVGMLKASGEGIDPPLLAPPHHCSLTTAYSPYPLPLPIRCAWACKWWACWVQLPACCSRCHRSSLGRRQQPPSSSPVGWAYRH